MANPWFRLYSEFADDPKVQMMPEVMQRRLIMLMCDRCKGVTVSERHMAFHWRISDAALAETKALFVESGFIDDDWNLLNWDKRQFQSDSSTVRTRQYRERHRTSRKRHSDIDATKSDVLDTDTEPDAEKEKPLVHGASADGPVEKDPDALIYEQYPRKEGHRAAIKQIQLAVVRLQRGEGRLEPMQPMDARRLLFRKTREYARSPAGQNPDKSKIPMPKTWYSQARYLDDSTQWNVAVVANGNSGNRGQARTDANRAAAEAAMAEFAAEFACGTGGGAPGFGEQGDTSHLRGGIVETPC